MVVEYQLLEKKMPWSVYMRDEKAIAIGAFMQKELVAYLVVTPEQQKTGYIRLNYLYVEPVWRGQYVGLDLLEYAERFLFYEGYRMIQVRLMDAYIRQMGIYHLLMEGQYIPCQEQNKLLVYGIETLLESERAKILWKCDIRQKNIIKIDSCLDDRYLTFEKQMMKRGIDLSDISFDYELSFFWQTKRNELSGCVLIEYVGTDMLIKYVYLQNKKKTDLLVLLREIVLTIRQGNKKQKVMIAVSNEKYFELFTYFFPKYLEQIDIWDYRKKL